MTKTGINNMRELFDKCNENHHLVGTSYPVFDTGFMPYQYLGDIPKFVEQNLNKTKELCLYVHIPFCEKKCTFCHCGVYGGISDDIKERYVNALISEIRMYKELIPSDTIIKGFDIGGGTPTELTVEQIKRIVDEVKTINNTADVYWSIETTPKNAANNPKHIKSLREMGFQRVSMGVQSMSQKVLNSMNRETANNDYITASVNVRAAGFENLNVDLMYGFDYITEDDIKLTVDKVIQMSPTSITLYKVVPKYTDADDIDTALDLSSSQYAMYHKLLSKRGYIGNYGANVLQTSAPYNGLSSYLYERSAFGTSYLGFGVAAQSFVHNYLSYNCGKINETFDEYFDRAENKKLPLQNIYDLPKEEQISKAMTVSMYSGTFDLKRIGQRFNVAMHNKYAKEIDWLCDNGYIKIDKYEAFEDKRLNNSAKKLIPTRITLTESGVKYQSGVIGLFHSNHSKKIIQNIKEEKCE